MTPFHLAETFSKRATFLVVILGLLFSVVVGSLSCRRESSFQYLDNLVYDAFLRHSAVEKTSSDVVTVDIDDVSLLSVGQWPWPRYKIAALIETIARMKPAAIGLDIIFPEPDRTALENIQKAFKDDFGLDIGFTGVPQGLTDNDGYLGYVLSRTETVGAKYFYFDHINKAESCADTKFSFTGHPEALVLNHAPGMLCNTPKIASQLKVRGFINNRIDDDGMLRRLQLLIQHGGRIYPNLSLATFMQAMGADTASIDADAWGPVLNVGGYRIPMTEEGAVLLKYHGPAYLQRSFPAVDILNGTIAGKEIKGKFVFIGSSAVGLNDLHHTIFDAQFPGVKTHAVLIENLLDGGFLQKPVWADRAVWVASILTGVLMSILFVMAPGPIPLFAGTAGWTGALWLLSIALFRLKGLFFSPGTPALIAAILFTLFSATRFATLKRHTYLWYRRLANAQQVTMASMATVTENRDPETGGHIKRTQHYVRAISEHLMQKGLCPGVLTPDYIELMFASAPLHDIGKVAIPDHILLKPARLTDEEFEVMKKHAEYGLAIIQNAAEKIEGNNFLEIAGEIAATHHEKWDGTGYPRGLAGEEIPLSGRIMAVADVYDALISKRCYKPAFPFEVAWKIIIEGRSTAFDPVIVDAFMEIEYKFREIASAFSDENEKTPVKRRDGVNPSTRRIPKSIPSESS